MENIDKERSIAQDYLEFQLKRYITMLFKSYLEGLEDNKFKHDLMLKKIKEAVPQEFHPIITAANYFDDRQFERIRKRVLDSGNQCKQEMESILDRMEVYMSGNLKKTA
jgi:hypothetical protein